MSKISYIAIFNKAGIACASNQDHTVYPLSKKEPVAIAINPCSPIPWVDLIEKYRSLGEPALHKTIEEYARDFESFLREQNVKEDWKGLSIDHTNIAFMGYGIDDIYPSAFDVIVSIDEETNKFKYECVEAKSISLENDSFWNMIGDSDSISPVLYGSRQNVKELCATKIKDALDVYRYRIMDAVKGLNIEQSITEKLEEMDCEAAGHRIVYNSTENAMHNVEIGMETFSIEEMVYAVEKLVNANTRMTRLINGNKKSIPGVKEIAVITRTEGFSWIKHSMFAI